MSCLTRLQFKPALVLGALLGGVLLVGCGSAYETTSDSAAIPPAASESGNPPAPSDAATEVVAQTAEVPRSLPQLVKTADLVVVVESVEESIDAAEAIARQQQGDLLGLQDQAPPDEYTRHTASMQFRVPQARLEPTLDALAELGTVQRQSLTAEDVSNQLVDFQARLRNLRKSEELLLEIMQRSGDVGEVLKVAQELSNIRNSIEQIDAQLSSLQNQVAYSTINLSLEETIAEVPPQRSVENQLQETWEGATRSVGNLTVDLLQLGLWLIVYSPYLLLLVGAVTFGYIRLRRQSSPHISTQEPPRAN